jgi:hypothetical protein
MPSSVANLNTAPANQGNSIGDALEEVTVAFKHLASALVQTVTAPAPEQTPALTAYDEAEALRTYAADIQNQDPDFAQDLFAAADRHETEAATQTAAR